MVRIEDYAVLGNLESAALVSRDGSIDWLCLPRFDSGACFAALLGTEENGCWSLRAVDALRMERRYQAGTLVLETDYETATGRARVVDAMIVGAEVPTLIRLVRGLSGSVSMLTELIVRFDYGSIVPWVTRDLWGDLEAVAGPDTIRLRTTVDFPHRDDLRTRAEFEVHEGELVPFVLTWLASHEDAPRMVEPLEAIDETAAFWRAWISRCTYEGPHEDAVHRSLLTLKALTYEKTGGIVAAVTTSLPETIGGIRNWDYRYCWIRDATLTLYSFLAAGYREEARQWAAWLIRTVAGTPSQLNIMYGLRGERRLTEIELPWLAGYEQSRPVRIGNAAHDQIQFDVFGELLGSFHAGREAGLDGLRSWSVEVALLKFLAEHWHEPDNGIWEVRGPKQHFTHSKIMAWVAFRCGIEAVERFGLEGPAEEWKRIAEEIHTEVCARGFDREMGSFVQAYDTQALDASLLMIPLVGFLPAEDPRVRGTVEAIEKHLMVDGFVKRYSVDETDDGMTGEEGAFLACTFWLVDNLVLLGRRDEAEAIFARLMKIRSDLGFLSEEYDVGLQRLVGNFPQAFSHVSLVNTAFNLQRTGL